MKMKDWIDHKWGLRDWGELFVATLDRDFFSTWALILFGWGDD